MTSSRGYSRGRQFGSVERWFFFSHLKSSTTFTIYKFLKEIDNIFWHRWRTYGKTLQMKRLKENGINLRLTDVEKIIKMDKIAFAFWRNLNNRWRLIEVHGFIMQIYQLQRRLHKRLWKTFFFFLNKLLLVNSNLILNVFCARLGRVCSVCATKVEIWYILRNQALKICSFCSCAWTFSGSFL